MTALTLGLVMRGVYGVLQGDKVIVLANIVGATLSGIASAASCGTDGSTLGSLANSRLDRVESNASQGKKD